MLKKKNKVLEKNTLNLMIIERPATQLRRMLPWVIICAVLLVLFSKFLVADRLMAADNAQAAADDAEADLEEVEEQLVDYDQVLAQYSRYFSDALGTPRDIMPLDSMEALDLVEKYVMSRVSVASIDFSTNSVSMQLTDTRLETASLLIAELDALPQVAEVTLYTANTNAYTGGNGFFIDAPKAETQENAGNTGATIMLTISFQEVPEQ